MWNPFKTKLPEFDADEIQIGFNGPSMASGIGWKRPGLKGLVFGETFIVTNVQGNKHALTDEMHFRWYARPEKEYIEEVTIRKASWWRRLLDACSID